MKKEGICTYCGELPTKWIVTTSSLELGGYLCKECLLNMPYDIIFTCTTLGLRRIIRDD